MLLRQSAFEGGNRFLKGALHAHTTRSDGKLPPEEALMRYELMGYDFAALTDHRVYNNQSYGPSTLTVIPGMEMDRRFAGSTGRGVHCIHTVSIGPAHGNGFAQDQRFESGEIADQDAYQPVLDMLHENGNMTIFCHPEWSGTPVHEVERLRGNFAMELWNTGCAMENEMDTDNGLFWDYLLLHGARIFGVATDDCHSEDQYGKGYVYVNAENSVDAILAALREGRFYASCGPQINDFTFEDGVARVRCSPAVRVGFCCGCSPTRQVFAAERPLDEATFAVPAYYPYIRAFVVDEKGRKAWTNPIFLDKSR